MLRQIARAASSSASPSSSACCSSIAAPARSIPNPRPADRPADALGPDDLERLKELVRQQPDATLKERANGSRSCSLHGHLRALEKLRLSRKKKVRRADERDRPGDRQEKRRDFGARLAGVDPHRLVFVDEKEPTRR